MLPTFSAPIHRTDLAEGVCILAPAPEPYRAAAERLRVALEKTLAARVEVLPDEGAGIGGRHVVALGNAMDSAFLRALYFRAYDLTDRAWPGPGGWVLRTIPRSLAGVGHVLVAGASQADEVPNAVEALIETVESPALPFRHRVHLGRWADLYRRPAEERLAKGDTDLEREHTAGAGDWPYIRAVGEIGMLAIQTGEEGLMRMFCRQVCHFARTRWFERHLPDPPQIHGFLRSILLPFTLLENHPAIPGDLREQALGVLLGLYRSTEGVANAGFLSQVGHDHVRQNHQTRSALDLYYGGRYFHQAHGLAEGLAWMRLSEIFYRPQMASNKPVCDSWGHQWSGSLCNTAEYALASGKMDYLASRPFLEGADRALIAHSALEGGPLHYFLMAAMATGNDEYLQHCGTEDEDNLVRRAVRGSESPLRTWVTGRRAAEPQRLGKVGVAPLSRLFYDSVEDWSGYAPKGVYQQDVPFEKTFDKVFFRSGWAKEDDYLLLDGISGGSHSYQDGNCIVRYTAKGRSWFGGRVGVASVRDHVGVSVAVDGAGPGCESRYATLRYLKEGERLSVSGTSTIYPGQADWRRHVVHSQDGWFLVIDEVQALREGEFLVEGRWHVLGEVALSDGVLRSIQGDARLTMRHAGSGSQDLVPVVHASERGGTRWVQRCLKRLRPGEGVRLATLFWADAKDRPRDLTLTSRKGGYRVEEEGAQVSVALKKVRAPRVEAGGVTLPTEGRAADASDPAAFHIPSGRAKTLVWRGTCDGPVTALETRSEGCLAGDDRGGVRAFDAQGRGLWAASLSGAIRALIPTKDGGVVAGGDAEKVTRLDAAGKEVWSHQLHWQPMNWDYWTRKNCIVLSLAAGDVNGDGKDEILAGCADRHIYAFDDAGRLLWRAACQWGPPTCLSLARLEGRDGMEILAGLADPSIFGCVRVYDARGTCVRTLSRPDLMCWSIPSWMKRLRVADLDGDGQEEVIAGVDTNHRQVIVYRRDGQVLWDADTGSAVLSVEVAGGRVYAGAANGFAQCFTADGRRQWSRFLVEPVAGLAPDASGGCIAALRGGRVVGLDGVGEVRTSWEGASGVTSSVWASPWPGGGLVVGRESGAVECCV